MEVTPTQTQQSNSASTPTDVKPTMANGSAGLETIVGGAPTTVSGVENASGGMGELVLPEVDKRIFMFERDQNALMQLMLIAKRVNVKSMEVKHYAIDQGTPIVTVADVSGNIITLVNADKGKVRAYDTLMVKGVKGYEYVTGTGNVKTRRPLQLFVKSVNSDDTITCVATNGIKQAATDQYGSLPTSANNNTNVIIQGTKLVRLSNALYETQKWVDPNTIIPVPDDLYLQKRGMTSIVSKYLADQNMEIPYDEAVKAEAQLREFKAAGNRTLLISQQNKMLVRSSMGDDQWDYTTNGVRWQVKREVKHRGAWTFEDVMALIKLYYGGADKPKSGIWLVGENLGMNLQLIDWTKHPEVRMEPYYNETLGWKVTKFTCIFGEIQIKLEETLNDCGYQNSGIIIGEDRLVHYVRRGESSYTEEVLGEEATRNGVLVSDALGLKGNCHIWVDGDDDDDDTAPNADEFRLWSSTTAPTRADLEDGIVYVFANALTLVVSHTSGNDTVVDQTVTVEAGDAYKYSASANSNNGGWKKFYGPISAE
ncbi:MAG: hypothetical protein II630_01205 [Bacteroidales bacterium]|nr:hypothetical protein [Bacteroidales bacterium]